MLALLDIYMLNQLQSLVGIGSSVSSNTNSNLQCEWVFLLPFLEGVLVTFAGLLTTGCSCLSHMVVHDSLCTLHLSRVFSGRGVHDL